MDSTLPRNAASLERRKLDLKEQTLKPGFHLIGARVETTWVPGAFQLCVRGSQRAPPHLVVAHPVLPDEQRAALGLLRSRGVAGTTRI
jgi:hypothetical protein